MNVWRKKTLRWMLNGKQSTKGTPGTVPLTVESKRFYGTLRLSDGRTR